MSFREEWPCEWASNFCESVCGHGPALTKKDTERQGKIKWKKKKKHTYTLWWCGPQTHVYTVKVVHEANIKEFYKHGLGQHLNHGGIIWLDRLVLTLFTIQNNLLNWFYFSFQDKRVLVVKKNYIWKIKK